MNFITKIMKKQENSKFAFNKINYILLGVGVALIIIEYFLSQELVEVITSPRDRFIFKVCFYFKIMLFYIP